MEREGGGGRRRERDKEEKGGRGGGREWGGGRGGGSSPPGVQSLRWGRPRSGHTLPRPQPHFPALEPAQGEGALDGPGDQGPRDQDSKEAPSSRLPDSGPTLSAVSSRCRRLRDRGTRCPAAPGTPFPGGNTPEPASWTSALRQPHPRRHGTRRLGQDALGSVSPSAPALPCALGGAGGWPFGPLAPRRIPLAARSGWGRRRTVSGKAALNPRLYRRRTSSSQICRGPGRRWGGETRHYPMHTKGAGGGDRHCGPRASERPASDQRRPCSSCAHLPPPPPPPAPRPRSTPRPPWRPARGSEHRAGWHPDPLTRPTATAAPRRQAAAEAPDHEAWGAAGYWHPGVGAPRGQLGTRRGPAPPAGGVGRWHRRGRRPWSPWGYPCGPQVSATGTPATQPPDAYLQLYKPREPRRKGEREPQGLAHTQTLSPRGDLGCTRAWDPSRAVTGSALRVPSECSESQSPLPSVGSAGSPLL